ncbi:MAG: Rossmann-like and DUF2520 domain-containing protein [Thermodesulfobacteriota bacterium]
MIYSVIGCGRVGINLAVYLAEAGYEPGGFYSRSEKSGNHARLAAGGQGEVFSSAASACRSTDVIFISTPDNTIEQVCSEIARENGFSSNMTVFHLSGALSSEILGPALKAGAQTGSIHPLQSFAPYEAGRGKSDTPSPFEGINISVEGSRKAVETGKEIVTALGANHFEIPTNMKTLYHAAAVVASNYLVTLEDFALSLLKEAGLSGEKGYEILEPLIRGTLNNIRNKGPVDALTGPVARGDTAIVERHIIDMEKTSPEFAVLYKLLGMHTLMLARKRGELGSETVSELERLFS